MSLIEVKKRITSTQNMRKITQAMQLVAANKMKFFQRQALAARLYVTNLMHGLQLSLAEMKELSYGQERAVGKTLFVIITSDKGLCGSLNTRLTQTLLRSEKWNSLSADQRLVITIGRKSLEAMRRTRVTPSAKFEGITEKLTPLEALKIIDTIISYWESGDVKEVVLVAPHYVNAFVAHPRLRTYLPLNQELIKEYEEVRQTHQPLLYEASEEQVVEAAALQLVQSLFMAAFSDLKASEYSSRMVAMKKATEAADDMIKALRLEFNRSRQAKITQELAELVAGTAAVS